MDVIFSLFFMKCFFKRGIIRRMIKMLSRYFQRQIIVTGVEIKLLLWKLMKIKKLNSYFFIIFSYCIFLLVCNLILHRKVWSKSLLKERQIIFCDFRNNKNLFLQKNNKI